MPTLPSNSACEEDCSGAHQQGNSSNRQHLTSATCVILEVTVEAVLSSKRKQNAGQLPSADMAAMAILKDHLGSQYSTDRTHKPL